MCSCARLLVNRYPWGALPLPVDVRVRPCRIVGSPRIVTVARFATAIV